MRKILIDEKYLFEVLTGRFGICEIGAILYAVQNCKDIELLNSESLSKKSGGVLINGK